MINIVIFSSRKQFPFSEISGYADFRPYKENWTEIFPTISDPARAWNLTTNNRPFYNRPFNNRPFNNSHYVVILSCCEDIY